MVLQVGEGLRILQEEEKQKQNEQENMQREKSFSIHKSFTSVREKNVQSTREKAMSKIKRGLCTS